MKPLALAAAFVGIASFAQAMPASTVCYVNNSDRNVTLKTSDKTHWSLSAPKGDFKLTLEFDADGSLGLATKTDMYPISNSGVTPGIKVDGLFYLTGQKDAHFVISGCK